MVNHFLLDDEQLLEHYQELIENSIEINLDDRDTYFDHSFKPYLNSEFEEVKNLILKRMKGEN